MDGFAAVDFGFAREVLQRGIAALYLVAFVSTLNQFRPLLGERGLLPAPELLEWAASSKSRPRMLRPTLFTRFRYTDRRLATLCWAGVVIAALIVGGIPQLAPPWVPMLCFLLLWAAYMSVSNIGQTFYGFGWEMLLLEAGFLAAFLGSNDQPPPTVVIVLFWWLLFRLEFGAGMIKRAILSSDATSETSVARPMGAWWRREIPFSYERARGSGTRSEVSCIIVVSNAS